MTLEYMRLQRGHEGDHDETTFSTRRTWIAKVSDAGHDEAAVLSYGPMPRIGEQLSVPVWRPFLYCLKRSAKQHEQNARVWTISAEYGVPEYDFNPSTGAATPRIGTSQAPTAKPARKWWSLEDGGLWFDAEDTRGQAYVNSAGDPLESPPGWPVELLVYNCLRNESSYDITEIDGYSGSCNSEEWKGFAEGRAKCSIMIGQPAVEIVDDQAFHFVPFHYKVAIHPRQWQPVKILDQGYRYKNDAGDWVVAADGGVYHGRSIKLDGSGKRLADDADPNWIERYPYDEIDLNGLNL